MDKPDASVTLGLELEGDVLKAIQLSTIKGKPKLDKFFEGVINLNHVNPFYNDNSLQELQTTLKKDLVITALNTQDILIRQLEIKLKKDKDIEEVLVFQTEPLLPYPSENAILDYIKIGTTEEGTLLTVLSARKDHLQHHLEQWEQLKIEPEAVTAVPAALTLFASTFVSSEKSFCIVHIGLYQSTCVLVQNSKLMAAQSISQGVIHLKNALENDNQKDFSIEDIKINELTAESHPPLFQAWDALRLELKRGIFSLSKQAKDQEIKELLITGSGSQVPYLATTLAQELQMQQIFPEIELLPSLSIGQIQNFAIPIGAALTGLPKTQDKINLRQNELSYPHPWKRLKNSLLMYAGLSLGLALAFYLFGQAYLSYQEDQIKQAYVELLEVMNEPYQQFEAAFETKNSSTPTSQILNIMSLDEKDIAARVEFLEKKLQSIPDVFPLLPHIPRVSDVLAWLSTQQILLRKNPSHLTIQIESFQYTLVKRPEQNKKQEKYQVKVEIEFSSPTPKQAREFHDALIEPNDFVDPKGEVKWNSGHGRYRASFYLKDKTQYPSLS